MPDSPVLCLHVLFRRWWFWLIKYKGVCISLSAQPLLRQPNLICMWGVRTSIKAAHTRARVHTRLLKNEKGILLLQMPFFSCLLLNLMFNVILLLLYLQRCASPTEASNWKCNNPLKIKEMASVNNSYTSGTINFVWKKHRKAQKIIHS